MNEETKNVLSSQEILGGEFFVDHFLAEAIANAPEQKEEAPIDTTPNLTLNDTFFPKYREEWDVIDPGEEFIRREARVLKVIEAGGIGILIGGPGAGKTRLMAETARQQKNPRRARYMKASGLFRMVRATYSDRNRSEEDVLQELLRIPLLYIDEIDKRSETPNENALLFSVVDDRFDLGKPTILAGNMDPADVAKRIDGAILDRTKQGGAVLHVKAPSHR